MSTGNGLSFEERLHNAILNFYKVDDLDQMVQFRLNFRLDLITPNPKLEQFKVVVFELIKWAIIGKRLPELTRVAAKYIQDQGANAAELAALVLELDAPRIQTQPALPPLPVAPAIPEDLLRMIQAYDLIPRVFADGPVQMRKQEEAAGQIRSQALVPYDLPGRLHLSESAGERLAAILALEQQPDAAYLRWLSERVTVEAPPAGYAAALALTYAALLLESARFGNLRRAVEDATDRLPTGPESGRMRSQLQDAQAAIDYRSNSIPRVPGLPFDEVAAAIMEAFTPQSLKDLLQTQLQTRLERLAKPDSRFEYIVFRVLYAADRAGWDNELIDKARLVQPGSLRLTNVYNRYANAAAQPV